MILHSDSLIELVYDVKTDILRVRWPDLRNTPNAVIENSFNQLIGKIKHYHITKLLIDSRTSIIEMPADDYKKLVFKLSYDLANTELKKIARILSEDKYRESQLQKYSEEITQTTTFKMESQEFEDEQVALNWLTTD